ncbi:MAG: hypothetical protein H0V18_05010 [Pyrinomonadaceae bacterium]|nr:hypothetical protein [Pyrinomonadaceae bacterium]
MDADRRARLLSERDAADAANALLARVLKETVKSRLKSFNAGDLSPRDLAYWFKIAAEVEALALGGPTQRIELETVEQRRERNVMDARRAYID